MIGGKSGFPQAVNKKCRAFIFPKCAALPVPSCFAVCGLSVEQRGSWLGVDPRRAEGVSAGRRSSLTSR